MVIKVCGLKERENYKSIVDLGVKLVGINFYPESSRYIDMQALPKVAREKRVGVFVNADLVQLKRAAKKYKLDYLQLHGDEDLAFCRRAHMIKPIIKVWRIDEAFDWAQLKDFDFARYFLFDTRVKDYGGSGQKFNWNLLEQYKGKTYFLLAGGIAPEDVEELKNIRHSKFDGVDINGRFEDSPGIKNVDLVANFVKEFVN